MPYENAPSLAASKGTEGTAFCTSSIRERQRNIKRASIRHPTRLSPDQHRQFSAYTGTSYLAVPLANAVAKAIKQTRPPCHDTASGSISAVTNSLLEQLLRCPQLQSYRDLLRLGGISRIHAEYIHPFLARATRMVLAVGMSSDRWRLGFYVACSGKTCQHGPIGHILRRRESRCTALFVCRIRCTAYIGYRAVR